MNFPIYNNNWFFDEKEIFCYLNIFPEHHVYFKRNPDGVTTHHHFIDGLHICIHWSEKNTPCLFFPVSMDKIVHLMLTGELELKHFNFLSYSFSSSKINSDSYDKFFRIFQNKERTLSPDNYFELEYNIEVKTQLPDSFFDAILKDVFSYQLFENYLKKNEGMTT